MGEGKINKKISNILKSEKIKQNSAFYWVNFKGDSWELAPVDEIKGVKEYVSAFTAEELLSILRKERKNNFFRIDLYDTENDDTLTNILGNCVIKSKNNI